MADSKHQTTTFPKRRDSSYDELISQLEEGF